MSMKKSDSKDSALMTEGSIFKGLLKFALPIILGNLLQQMYNTVDSIIVGNYVGSTALAAVGASTFLIYLLIAFSQGVSVGAGVIISQYLGAKNRDCVHKSVHTAFALAFILGALLTAGGFFLSRFLLVAMNTPDEILHEADTYLRIYSCGLFFNVAYNMAAGILNASGNSKRALMYLASASFTNIVLDIVLIRFCRMGVAGAALATDISQAVSFALAFIYLVRTKADCKVNPAGIRIDRTMAKSIIRIGIPTGVQSMVISFANIIVQTGVNGFGAAAIAGFGAYLKIDGFNILPIQGLALAVTTFIGQNYGAGRIDRVKKGAFTGVVMVVAYCAVTGILIAVFSRQLMQLFSRDEEVIYYGRAAVRVFCPWYWGIGILQVLCGTVRGTGKGLPPMIIMLLSLCIFRMIWMYFVLPLFSGINGIFIMFPVSWFVGVALILLYLLRGKWLTHS